LRRLRERDAIGARFSIKRYNVGIIGYGWVARAQIAAINATSLAQVTSVKDWRAFDELDN
jgi:hypothetical protein